MKFKNLVALGCISVIVAACGGGGGGGDLGVNSPTGSGPTAAVPASVPASALASVDSFVAYLRQLAGDESSEPLELPDVGRPITDTTEPSSS